MGAQTRQCPRCGHENVSRALFCFQCGYDLSTVRSKDSLKDGTVRLDSTRYVRDRLQSKPRPDGQLGEPLTCLHCGTFNRADAVQCSQCRVPLAVPDEDFGLVARPSARTSVGGVRHNNEDNLSLWAAKGVVLALIADGMGGAAAGEEASRLVVESVQADFLSEKRGSDELATQSENDLSNRLADAIHDANRAVMDKALANPQLKGMGTTSTLAMVRANRLMIAHVGDSRAYHIDGKTHESTQITSDHSFVQALVASGHITAEQARSHPMNNVLYRALGQSLDLEVDAYARFVRAGDQIILCSDGLTRHLQPEDITRIVTAEPSPYLSTQKLIDLANSRGGEDNISVIVIKIANELSDATQTLKPG